MSCPSASVEHEVLAVAALALARRGHLLAIIMRPRHGAPPSAASSWSSRCDGTDLRVAASGLRPAAAGRARAGRVQHGRVVGGARGPSGAPHPALKTRTASSHSQLTVAVCGRPAGVEYHTDEEIVAGTKSTFGIAVNPAYQGAVRLPAGSLHLGCVSPGWWLGVRVRGGVFLAAEPLALSRSGRLPPCAPSPPCASHH